MSNLRISRLEGELDRRLFNLLREALDAPEKIGDWELFIVFLRAAYGAGYCDALIEDARGERNQLGKPLGYKLPERPVPVEEPPAGT